MSLRHYWSYRGAEISFTNTQRENSLKFLVDRNLPTGLLPVLGSIGHHARHVKRMGLTQASDETIWAVGATQETIIVSKDADFLALAKSSSAGALLRQMVSTCSNQVLYAIVRQHLDAAVLRL